MEIKVNDRVLVPTNTLCGTSMFKNEMLNCRVAKVGVTKRICFRKVPAIIVQFGSSFVYATVDEVVSIT